MTVVVATAADAKALAALHRQCFTDAWNANAFRDLLSSYGAFAYAVPHAFIVARAAAGEAEILTLGTLPASRRTGAARALVLAAAAEAHQRGAAEMFLEVAADNAPAVALYANLGFTPVGRRKGYYVRGPSAADAITLRAALPLPENPAQREHGAAHPG